MPSRTPGGESPDPAAELLGRWQAHHSGEPEPIAEPAPQDDPPPPTDDTAIDTDPPDDISEPEQPTAPNPPSAPRHAAPRATPGRRRTPSPRGFDQTEAGREIVEALGITQPGPSERAEPADDATTPDASEEPWPDPLRSVEGRRRRTDTGPAVGQTTDVVFAPRTALRRILGFVVLAAAVASALACWAAYAEPRTITIGVAAVLVVATLVLYGVRASSSPPHLAIRSGQLEVVRGNRREVFDLTSRFTRMEVIGRPGRRGWKVLMARFGRDPLVIDSSMVDPLAFTAALERHRPR
jgi:hypothetical protein